MWARGEEEEEEEEVGKKAMDPVAIPPALACMNKAARVCPPPLLSAGEGSEVWKRVDQAPRVAFTTPLHSKLAADKWEASVSLPPLSPTNSRPSSPTGAGHSLKKAPVTTRPPMEALVRASCTLVRCASRLSRAPLRACSAGEPWAVW